MDVRRWHPIHLTAAVEALRRTVASLWANVSACWDLSAISAAASAKVLPVLHAWFRTVNGELCGVARPA